MDTTRFEALLAELKLPFEREQVEDDLVQYAIRLDDAEELEIQAYVLELGEEVFVRLLHYVDELDPEAPLDQLRLLMSLNGELPAGCFCLDPQEGMLYATANVLLAGLDGEQLSWLIEALLVAEEIYETELNPEDGEVVAQG